MDRPQTAIITPAALAEIVYFTARFAQINSTNMVSTLEIKKELVAQSKLPEVDFDNIVFGRVYSDHMFVADYADGDWKNFRINPYEFLRLSPANATLHYGQSIFEGLKAYRSPEGEILVFRPMDNYRRLNHSGRRMCIPELPEDVFMQGLTELLRTDKGWVPEADGTSLYIRPFIFAADEYIGIRPSDTYRFMIFTCPVGAYYSGSVKVKIETQYSRAFPGGTGSAKAAGNYAGSLYPAKLAQQQGYHQLVWTDGLEHKYIEESGTMNVMFIIDDTLITAPAGDTILNGITRDSVLTLARDWGMKVEERPVEVAEVVDAARAGKITEAFGTGTAATIAQIDTIGIGDEQFALPAVEGREFSNKVLKTLNDIRYGRIEDPHNWVYKI